MKNLYKYYCPKCDENYAASLHIMKKCDECGEQLESKEIEPQDYLDYVASELENANCHRQTHLPEDLFTEITESIELTESQQNDLAKVISQVFYNNI